MLRKYIFIKSVTDYILGLTILLITLPFTLLISLRLALLFKSSPFIIQKRGITEGNKVFNIFKFKTMQPIKCIFNKEYNPLPEMGDILFKKQLEEYVPTFCRWLRKRGLDELPQLINVLKGEMSLIGPRPLMISDLVILRRCYPEYYTSRINVKVKPGITGLWQVFGKREKGIGNLLFLDIEYDNSVSFILDLKIFLFTLPLVIRGKHSDAIISDPPNRKVLNKADLFNSIPDRG